MASLTFNIVYTSGSVHYLGFYVKSLLNSSAYRFRLVANGCPSDEQEKLKKLCSRYADRLIYFALSANEIVSHGEVLNYLQEINTEKYFCFMDSDIFATGQLPDFNALMEGKNLAAVFSAMPLWVKKNEEILLDDFVEIVGTFNKTKSNQVLGSTYFAIYDNQQLTEIRQLYRWGFQDSYWNDLPSPIQIELEQMNWKKKTYDTGKILNIFFNKHCKSIENIDISELCHIGGTSFEVMNQQQNITSIQKIKALLQKTLLRFFLTRREDILLRQKFMIRYPSAQEFSINYNQRVLHRNPVRKHFLFLFHALVFNQKIPALPAIKDEEVYEKIKNAEEQYIQMFKKYYAS